MTELVNAVEAGEILGITDRWVAELIKRGELPAQRVGKQYIIDRADVERLKAQRDQAEQKPGRK